MSQNSTGKFSSALFRPAFGVIAGALLLTASFEASAQVVYNEGFEQAPLTGATAASTAPYATPTAYSTLWPNGWISGKYGAGVDTDNRWDRVRASGNPTANARTGNGMIRYLADYTTSGEAAFISCKRLDFQGWTTGNAATTSFWITSRFTCQTTPILPWPLL
jgi:hypothetical protein